MAIDPNAAATVAPEPTQDAPVTGQLQAPAAAPPSQSLSLEPGTPPITAVSPNVRLHTFVARHTSALLDAIVGTPGPNYSVDSATGKTIATAAPPQTTGQKLRRLADKALVGLSAGAQVGPQKSAAASWAAGLGAGAEAEQGKELGRDLLKKKQSKEEFEMEQQAQLHHMEIGRLNALTASTYFANKKMANEMTPEFSANESLFNAAKASPELGAHATEMSDTQLAAEEAKDHMFTQTHIIKPMGWAPELDANGAQVTTTDDKGNSVPKFYMRVGVINGTKEGKIQVTPELAADFKQYGPMARIPNAETIKAGDSYDLQSLVPALSRVEEQKKEVLKGWATSETGWVTGPDGKESLVETNKTIPYGMPGRTRPLVAKPLAVEAEQGKTALEKAQAFEAGAKGKEALANAAMIAGNIIGDDGTFQKSALPDYMRAVEEVRATNPNGYTVLRNVPPVYQKAVLLVANGDATVDDATKNPRKGVPVITPIQMETYASLVNPKWTKQLFQTKKDAAEDMLRKNGDSIKAFGQFGVHVGDLKEVSDRFQRTGSPWINQPLNLIKSKGAGQAGVPGMMAAVEAVRSEWQNVIKSGHAADLASNDESRRIMSDASTPQQILDAAKVMGSQVIGRLDQVDNIWRRSWGGHYPGILSDSARAGFESIGLSDAVSQYPRESGPMFGAREGGYGQPQNQPQLSNMHKSTDGKQTIGWDGKQWVDVATKQPYAAPATSGVK
jgi:hypothetical protein